MRLTPNVVLDAPRYTNVLKEYTAELRGLRIPLIENLAVANDQYETIDLTDNEITLLGNFPELNRLRTLLLARNRVQNIQAGLATSLPFLTTLSLLENNITSFNAILPLRHCKRLQRLYLRGNRLTLLDNYRLFLIWLLPQLTILDFEKVKEIERKQSVEKFGSSFDNKTELAEQLLSNTSLASSGLDYDKDNEMIKNVSRKLTDEDRAKLKQELQNASSLHEIDRIETALKSGYI